MQTKKFPTEFKEFSRMYTDIVYNELIKNFPQNAPKSFSEMLHSYTDRKGQYRRPAYLLAWTLLFNGNIKNAILPAAIQQLSEDYFLMHDDWMDGNKLRRGYPTAHVIYGPIYAVLAGDTLHAIMWKMLYKGIEKLDTDLRSRYINKFADMMVMTHIGQYIDLHMTNDIKDITKFTKKDYYESIHAKSAYYSIYGPMQCGAIIAGAKSEDVEKIAEYGIPIGNAFQIKDDILDCISNEKELGKSIGNDVKQNTKTLILWHAVQNASSTSLKRLKQIYEKSPESKSKSDIKFVLDSFEELGSIKFAEMEANMLANKALKKFGEISSNIPETDAKKLAISAISHAAIRKK